MNEGLVHEHVHEQCSGQFLSLKGSKTKENHGLSLKATGNISEPLKTKRLGIRRPQDGLPGIPEGPPGVPEGPPGAARHVLKGL